MTDFNFEKTAVALGNFDGMHKGHMAVVNTAAAQKNSGLCPVILLFEPHPQKVLNQNPPKALFDGNIKEQIFNETGCFIHKISFRRIKDMPPEDFVSEILKKELNASFVSCGFNFRFGKNGSGDTSYLKMLCEKYSVKAEIIQPVMFKDEYISSTKIRLAIENGDIQKANAMLGRSFAYDFTVVDGDKIGRKLGFPTINQLFPDDFTVPKFAVYASAVFVNGKRYPAVTNIGTRPTVTGNGSARSETTILGFSGDLYGKNPKVELLSYLRDEIKFPSLEKLTEQIKNDCKKSLEIFNCGEKI